MTQKEFLSIYESVVINSYVEGFRLSGQFPVLELQNEKENKKIELHIDCRISSNNDQLNNLVHQFSDYDKDVFEIAYFIGINRKKVKCIRFSSDNNFHILFENSTEITFKINDQWSEPLNISISKNDKYLMGCRLFNDGTIS